jgi:hypothetical protein
MQDVEENVKTVTEARNKLQRAVDKEEALALPSDTYLILLMSVELHLYRHKSAPEVEE